MSQHLKSTEVEVAKSWSFSCQLKSLIQTLTFITVITSFSYKWLNLFQNLTENSSTWKHLLSNITELSCPRRTAVFPGIMQLMVSTKEFEFRIPISLTSFIPSQREKLLPNRNQVVQKKVSQQYFSFADFDSITSLSTSTGVLLQSW